MIWGLRNAEVVVDDPSDHVCDAPCPDGERVRVGAQRRDAKKQSRKKMGVSGR